VRPKLGNKPLKVVDAESEVASTLKLSGSPAFGLSKTKRSTFIHEPEYFQICDPLGYAPSDRAARFKYPI